MPALVAFRRKWQVASDDFVFPGLVDLFIRVSWLIAVCIIYWKHDANLACDGGHYMRVYLYGTFIVLLGFVFADVALIQNSMSSYMMDQEARKYVTPILYLRLLLEVPEVGWNTLGTIWLFQNTVSCPVAPEAVTYMKVLIWFNWGLCITILIGIGLAFDPLGSSTGHHMENDYERFEVGLRTGRTTRVWEKRCKVLMCSCVGNDEMSRDAFKEMGKIISLLFEDLDFVPSDIAAGLIVLNLKSQAEAERRTLLNGGLQVDVGSNENLHHQPITHEGNLESHLKAASRWSQLSIQPDPWTTPRRISHFMKFALGSYGWPWFLVAHMKSGLCRLWENILCCGCCVSHPCDVEGDNCCYCNFSALKDTVKIEDRDILYTSFRNNFFETPFFVAIDHSTSSIVIAIRGTMSLRDAITDLLAEAKTLEDYDFPPDFKAHYGMILSAKNVLEKLETMKVVQKAFSIHPDYNLVITGHSLGAGTATILGMMLRKQFPTLRCYAYSPPGGLLTLAAAIYCEEFTTSIVLGDDIVCRLSVTAFEKFKLKLQETIKSCKIPKYQILMGGCWYFLVGGIPKSIISSGPPSLDDQNSARRSGSDAQLLQGNCEQPTNYHTYVSLAEESHRLHREAVTKCPLYMPGKILLVTERPIFQSRPDLVEGARFEYRWADREEFNEILVTPNMWTHHYPDTLWSALTDVANFEPEPFAVLTTNS